MPFQMYGNLVYYVIFILLWVFGQFLASNWFQPPILYLTLGRFGTDKFGNWGWHASSSPWWYWRCKDYRKLCCGELIFNAFLLINPCISLHSWILFSKPLNILQFFYGWFCWSIFLTYNKVYILNVLLLLCFSSPFHLLFLW